MSAALGLGRRRFGPACTDTAFVLRMHTVSGNLDSKSAPSTPKPGVPREVQVVHLAGAQALAGCAAKVAGEHEDRHSRLSAPCALDKVEDALRVECGPAGRLPPLQFSKSLGEKDVV